MKYLAHIIVVIALVAVLGGGYAATLAAVSQQATWTPNPAVITFPASPGNGFTTVQLTCTPTVTHARLVTVSNSPSMNIFTFPYPDQQFVCNSTPTSIYIGANCLLTPASSCGPTSGRSVTYTGTIQCVNDDQYQGQCGPSESVNVVVTANKNTLPTSNPAIAGQAPTIFYSILGGIAAVAAGAVVLLTRKKIFPSLAK